MQQFGSDGYPLGSREPLSDDDAARFAELLAEVEPTLREMIKDERETRQWSQARLARELKRVGLRLDATAITRMEKGDRSIRAEELWALAVVFQVGVTELLAVATDAGGKRQRLENLQHQYDAARTQLRIQESELQDMLARIEALKADIAREAP
jgi:transcriptional regulator with XRE-family HTH domain